MAHEINHNIRSLGDRCRTAALAWRQLPSPPLTAEQLRCSQDAINASLPSLLTDLFTIVGNGGFGPQGGLLGLSGGHTGDDSQLTIDQMYHELMWDTPEEAGMDWPAELLPVAEGGCGLLYCVDLASSEVDLHLTDLSGFTPGDAVPDYTQPCVVTLFQWLDTWSRTPAPQSPVAVPGPRSPWQRLISWTTRRHT